jgi:hypothetical protein
MIYPKIETLFERGSDFKVKPGVLKNNTYGLLKEWEWTEKIDGTNIRCIWQPKTAEFAESLTFGGRSDNAQIHADLIKWLYENVKAENLREILSQTPAVIYGEGYGAGIQKGGDYSPTKKFIIFDVLVDGTWWLSWDNVCDIANKLGLETVPFIGTMPLEDATEFVKAGFMSKIGNGKAKAEGLVGRPTETLFDKKRHRLICKLKTKDF